MRLVLDTNVLVSALLKPGSVPDRALSAIWRANATVLHDACIVDEYRSVLGRPKFCAIDRACVDALLERVRARGEDLGAVPRWEGHMADEGDRIFVSLALVGRADAIVTGNLKHYPLDQPFEVLPPASLLARLGG